jgi:CDP-alcohol phosphatidyltransferase-like enzyme
VQQPVAGLDIQATYKARDVEGLLDIHFYRKVGFHLARFFAKLNLTPVAVTWLGTVIGIAAGHFYFYHDLRLNAVGMALHIMCNMLDNADGQLARMTNKGSRTGRVLDGLGDFLVFASVYLHLCLRCLAAGGSDLIWFIAISAGASHLIQTAVADYLRNAYLYFVSGSSRGEFDTSAALRKEFNQLSWRTAPWQKFLLRVYLNYTRQQEMLVPRMKKVKRRIDERSAIDGGQWLIERYRRGNKWIVKCANFFGRNTRMALLFVLLVLDLPAWYFVFELTAFNLLLALVLLWQAKAFDRFLDIVERVPVASVR